MERRRRTRAPLPIALRRHCVVERPRAVPTLQVRLEQGRPRRRRVLLPLAASSLRAGHLESPLSATGHTLLALIDCPSRIEIASAFSARSRYARVELSWPSGTHVPPTAINMPRRPCVVCSARRWLACESCRHRRPCAPGSRQQRERIHGS
ncbi:hypothetical protein T492DRAFT_1013164 [Pavlovales sp. CCMP2436]|nr:hypothetical protein T492DRAFT_1013164 [Pavlovales sp. CCMP2436]